MSQAMDDLNTSVASIGEAISAEIAGLTAEITNLKMQGSSATVEDTAGIEAAVGRLSTLADQLKGATPAAPAPTPAPATPTANTAQASPAKPSAT